MVLIRMILILTYSLSTFSKTQLLEFTAKQNIFNIKYIAKENDTTFYLKGNDTLALSTNYKALEILKQKGISEFGVVKNPNDSTYLIFSKQNNFESLSPLLSGDIYLFNTNSKKMIMLGNGINPKFNTDGTIISYFQPELNKIIFRKKINLDNPLEIRLNSKQMSFIPQVEIVDEKNIYYTDRNNDYKEGVIKLDFLTQKRIILIKSENIQTRFEICSNSKEVNILETNISPTGFTFIYSLAHSENDLSKRNFLFDSKSGSSFQMSCSEKEIFFIKYFGDNAVYSELFRFDIASKKTFVISDLDFVTNYFKFEENIYIPFRRNIYAVQNKEKNWTISKEFKENLNDEVNVK